MSHFCDILTPEILLEDRLQNALFVFKTENEVKIPITCPVTLETLVHPAIGRNCRHNERIELFAFLKYVFRIRKWVCPVCNIFTPLADILIDSVMQEAVESTGDDHSVEFIRITNTVEWSTIKKMTTTRRSFMASAFGSSSDRNIMRGFTQLMADLHPMFGAIPTKKVSAQPVDQSKTKRLRRSITTVQSQASVSNFHTAINAYLMHPFDIHPYKFSLESNSWTPVPSIPNIGNLLHEYTLVFTDECFYALGGVDSSLKPVNTALQISEELGAKIIESMTHKRYAFPAVWQKDEIYVIGGVGEFEPIAECEMFDERRKFWMEIAPLPEPRGMCAAVADEIGKLYVFGGATDTQKFSNSILCFEFTLDTWTELPVTMPYDCLKPLAFQVPSSDVILLLGGRGLRGSLDRVLALRGLAEWDFSLPRLSRLFEDYYQFPIIFDYKNNVIHFFQEEKNNNTVYHFYYNLSTITEVCNINESDEFHTDTESDLRSEASSSRSSEYNINIQESDSLNV